MAVLCAEGWMCCGRNILSAATRVMYAGSRVGNWNFSLLCGWLFLVVPNIAAAHFFGSIYTLPIPFWMYAYGASGALVASFAIVAYFVSQPVADERLKSLDLTDSFIVKAIDRARLLTILQGVSVFSLILAIAAGLFGNQNPFDNFCVSVFWVGFFLGFIYLSALLGNICVLLNPWRVLMEWLDRRRRGSSSSNRVKYPDWLGYWPALVLYILFIWIELFGHFGPRSLALTLCLYTLITLLCASFFGPQTWIRYGEFFGIIIELVAKMAPLQFSLSPRERYRLALRPPMTGLIAGSADRSSLVIFALFMLSSTAFDGAHETSPWIAIFWKGLYPLIDSSVKRLSTRPYETSASLYYAWQWSMLALLPFFYYGIYLGFILLTKHSIRCKWTVRELSLRFAFTLIPIAFVYNISHYYTLLITEGPRLLASISDPFGVGWNLFGIRHLADLTIVPGTGFVWHSQVGLILAGHVVSVYLSHVQALRTFSNPREATLSQLPMLVLMVIFTASGLWILSLPIAPG